MKRFIVVLVLCLWVTLCQAGHDEGGVLVVHHDPSIVCDHGSVMANFSSSDWNSGIA
jgi:hypothetical protein